MARREPAGTGSRVRRRWVMLEYMETLAYKRKASGSPVPQNPLLLDSFGFGSRSLGCCIQDVAVGSGLYFFDEGRASSVVNIPPEHSRHSSRSDIHRGASVEQARYI